LGIAIYCDNLLIISGLSQQIAIFNKLPSHCLAIHPKLHYQTRCKSTYMNSYSPWAYFSFCLLALFPNCQLFSQNPCPTPISNGNKIICEGEPIPTLSVVPAPNLQTNWYNMPFGGLVLASNTTSFIPTNSGIFYVENSDPNLPCNSARTPIELSIKPRPIVNAGPDQQVCLGNCTDLTASGALIYQWNQGTNTAIASVCPAASQFYTVLGTDIWGCTDIDTILLNVLNLSAPISLGNKIICDGLALPTLGVAPNAGLQINWYDQASGGNLLLQNSATYQPAYAGVFYAEFKNTTFNCVSSRTAVQLDILPKPSVTLIGNPNFCLGDCRNFVAFGGVNYLWNTSETINQIEICPTESAQYSVTVTGTNTCTATKTLFAQVDSVPILTLQTVQCAVDLDDYEIKFTASAFDNITSNTGILNHIGVNYQQNLIQNNINTTITAVNGTALCTTVLNIPAPNCDCPTILPPISTGNHAICEGTDIPLLSIEPINGNTVFWYNTPTGGQTFLKNKFEYQATQTGVFFVEIIDTITGCSSTRTPIRLTVDSLPLAKAGEDKYILCLEDFVQLDGSQSTATQGITHLWTTNSGNIIAGNHTQTPLVDSAGMYILTVTADASGCSTQDSVRVIKRTPPTAEIQTIDPKCTNENGIIRVINVQNGTAPFRYAVTGQNFTSQPDFFNLVPKEYLVVVLDSAGCTWQSPATIEAPPEQVIFLASILFLQYSEQATLQPQISFSLGSIDSLWWKPQFGLDCYDCLMPNTSLFESQNYELTVIDTNDCVIKAFTSIQIAEPAIYSPNTFSPASQLDENRFFTIYSYEGAVQNIEYLQIFDRWGELVFENKNFIPNQYSLGWDGLFKGKLAQPSVYFWVASLKYADGKAKKSKGTVTLIR
jgi:hypothetical protein